MRLVTFSHQSRVHLGAEIEKNGKIFILDLNKEIPDLAPDMTQMLQAGNPALNAVSHHIQSYHDSSLYERKDVKIMAPVPKPGKMICVGLNYRDHAAEGNRPVPEVPTIFSKFSNCIIGPEEMIQIPLVTSQVDYEVELAVVIGQTARHISQDEALRYVAGYTIINDVSARDYQMRTGQWTIGKIFDSFAPMGPALVTTDEIPDPGSLEISLTLNDQVMQHSNTRNLIFTVPFLISYLSQVLTLEAGDIIATGTPAGVGVFRDPPVFLKPGDKLVLSIESIGELKNTVTAEKK